MLCRVVGHRVLFVGRPQWLGAIGFDLEEAAERLVAITDAGQTPILVGAKDVCPGTQTENTSTHVAGQWLLGIVAVVDDVCPLAVETIASLRKEGVRRIALLSGDNMMTVSAVASQVGIAPEDVHAELLPDEKLTAIEEYFRNDGHGAMVGDGVNDVPALAAAIVGIALGTGSSDTALGAADVALLADDISRLPWA